MSWLTISALSICCNSDFALEQFATFKRAQARGLSEGENKAFLCGAMLTSGRFAWPKYARSVSDQTADIHRINKKVREGVPKQQPLACGPDSKSASSPAFHHGNSLAAQMREELLAATGRSGPSDGGLEGLARASGKSFTFAPVNSFGSAGGDQIRPGLKPLRTQGQNLSMRFPLPEM
jgi:hypothetical protein